MSLSVVFDTNILFSGLGWRGTPFVCMELARDGEVESVTCSEILAELEGLLRKKRQMTVEEAARGLSEVLAFSRLVAIPGVLTGVLSDPDDHKVLECAVAGEATHIVSGDRRHLLPLKEYQGIRILTATEFLRVVGEAS